MIRQSYLFLNNIKGRETVNCVCSVETEKIKSLLYTYILYVVYLVVVWT